MPYKPKPACPKCRRMNCTDPTHKPKPFVTARPRSERRPDYHRDRGRRREAVKAHIAAYGEWCPLCGRVGVKLTADHIHAVGLSGDEFGALSVHCLDCQRRQGARVANERRGGRQSS